MISGVFAGMLTINKIKLTSTMMKSPISMVVYDVVEKIVYI